MKHIIRISIIITLFILCSHSVFAVGPEATNISASETYTEDISLNLVDIVISDVDSVNTTATLTLSNPAAGSLTTGTSGVVTSTYNSGTGVWTATGPIANVNALLAGLTFVPSTNFNSNFFINTKVEDDTTSANGTKFFTGVAINDAPVLDSSKSPTMVSVAKNAGVPTGAVGTLVSSLVDFAVPAGQVDNIVDVDSGSVGIAVVAYDSSNLSCFFSLNGGATWTTFGTVSNTSARLLASDADNRIYCRAGLNVSGVFTSAITFNAWDGTSGADGGLASAASTGGSTAFSTATDTIRLTVTSTGNNIPVATNDEYTIDQNAPLTSLSVLENDTDADNDELGITSIDQSGTAGEALISAPPIAIGYTPAVGFCGDDEFTYDISDGNGGTSQATVLVHVVNCDSVTESPILITPEAGSTHYTNTPLIVTFTLPELLATGSLVLSFLPADGPVIILQLRDAAPGTNTFSFYPRGGFGDITEIISSNTSSIPAGVYTATLSYQDVYGNPVALDQSTNVTFLDPVVTTSAPVTTSGSTIVWGCKDPNATNYNQFSASKPSLCVYKKEVNDSSVKNVGVSGMCSSSMILTQNLRAGSRDGKYDAYTRGIVKEAKLLQAHLNRLGFGSGKEDGILGLRSETAIKKLQKFLNVAQDGKIGPKSREVINNSCGA